MTSPRIEQLRELLASDPEDITLHYMLGLEYLDDGRPREAIAHLEKYLEVEEAAKSDVGACLGRLAAAYRETGRREEAIRAYRRGILSAIEHKHADLRNELSAAMKEVENSAG